MKNVTTIAPHAARILLGLAFFVFGLNGFLNFLPPPEVSGDAAVYMGGLAATGYFFPLLKATEVLVGLALLSNRFVPLGLVVLAPITVHIIAFHAVLSPGLGLPLVLTALQLAVAWAHRESFRSVLAAKPEGADAPADLAAATHATA